MQQHHRQAGARSLSQVPGVSHRMELTGEWDAVDVMIPGSDTHARTHVYQTQIIRLSFKHSETCVA